MDIRAILTFVANHVEQIFGTTLVLFFLTCLLLLIRSIGSKKEDGASGSVTAAIDPQSIEDAVRRALTAHGPLVATGSGAVAPVPEGATPESLSAAIQERDARIEQLSRELEQLRAQVTNAVNGPDAGVIGISDSELAELRAKLDEMQARLAEYEIIEDDIADLSMFKDENARLKTEIEDLRTKLTNLAPKSIVQEAPPPIPTSELSELGKKKEEPVVEEAPAPAPELPAAAAPASVEDDVMREFAAAVQVQKAPPAVANSGIPIDAASIAAMASASTADTMKSAGDALDAFAQAQPREMVTEDPQAAVDAILAEAESQVAAASKAEAPAPAPAPAEDVLAGETDPDKMLSEVASLEAAETAAPAGESSSALEESLDTDKLLAEVGSLATQNAKPEGESQSDDLNGDDLLSEFTGQTSKK